MITREMKILVGCVMAGLCLPLLGAAGQAKPTITVLAAISLREAVEEIAAEHERSVGVTVRFVFGASGQLAMQLRNGAPADVFLSAADQPVDALAADGLIDKSSRTTIAGNVLVLIVPTDAKAPVMRFDELGSARVRRLAIGEPRTVPAGAYAKDVLATLGLEKAVGEKLVFGTNVKQVLDYVVRGETDAGVVYATDAGEAGNAVRVVAKADPSWHKPIRYVAVVSRDANAPVAARAFVAALGDAPAQRTFERHGFLPATAPTTRAVSTQPTR